MSILDRILKEYSNNDKCKIRDPEKVESILQRLKKDGPSKLQIITDFDHTLTRFHKDGRRCDTCHGILDNSLLMPEEYRQKAKALFEKYYYIEIDHEMTIEEKIPHMITWYKKSHDLLVEYKLSESNIREMVQKSRAFLRDSACDVLSLSNELKVPVLIFSAGVGNILEEVLNREKAFLPNVKVVSNYMDFDENHICRSFREPLIHMFNKNETALAALGHSEYFQDLSHRNNAIVLGDSMGDLQMDSGVHNPGAILKIGFLNDKIAERLDSFFDNFDVVLLDDQSFKFLEVILKEMSTGTAT